MSKTSTTITVDVSGFTDEALVVICNMMASDSFLLDLDDGTTPFYVATRAEALRRRLIAKTPNREAGLPPGTRFTAKGKRAFERADNL